MNRRNPRVFDPYRLDINTGKLDKIADTTPWLDENEMASMVPVEYKSRDGLTTPGYLTLPRGYTPETAKNMAVVVNPHGGPWACDNWGFNPEVQFLANRGYVVFQINFRGSTGYGRAFREASFTEWGKKMQNDITDGMNWLIEQGIADKSKIAIYGASYGGYATLSGVAFTPDLHAAAVDYVGVSNIFTFFKSIPPYWLPQLQMMYEMVGNPVNDSILLREASPLFSADRIKTPLFVAQGANDLRVNINESNQMVDVRAINEHLMSDPVINNNYIAILLSCDSPPLVRSTPSFLRTSWIFFTSSSLGIVLSLNESAAAMPAA